MLGHAGQPRGSGAGARTTAWATGNGDLHAKNLSVLQRDGEWRVAPVYDVPSTVPYGPPRRAHPAATPSRPRLLISSRCRRCSRTRRRRARSTPCPARPARPRAARCRR
ncbi:HipA domain-containing protein [Serinicoccus sp. CNJ-927]|uniref:HipA domain-containing protein n=1 Tax=Serinicoccus sp. CNJ-927 TaxID=1904970 RepID=UPI0039E17EED